MPARALAAREPAPAATEASPFKFLDYFRREDEAKFAGRDGDVAEVLGGIARSPLLVLYGRSGVGKTSLLLAGVFPRLVERGFEPLRIRLGDDPVPELARQFGAPDEEGLRRALDRMCTARPLVLALDQFEELFVRFRDRPEVRTRIGKLLASILAASSRVRIVLGVREDYLAELKDLAPYLGDPLGNAYRLGPPTAFGAHQAIVRPLEVAGVSYDERFVSLVVEELADCGYDPAVLQIACSEVYGIAAGRPGRPVHLSADDWKALGGSRGVFLRFLARVGQELGDGVALARAVLAEMITPEGNRRQVRPESVARTMTRVPQAEIERLLAGLDERFRLVRRPEGKDWYELRHDRLVPAVREWLQSDPDFAHVQLARALVAQMAAWPAWRTSAEGLIQGPQLAAYVVPYGERIPLDADGAELLVRSAVHAGDPSVRMWAGRLEALAPGRAGAVLSGLLDDPSPVMRAHAASAVQWLEHPAKELLDRCLALALEDEDPGVRADAGEALARTGAWDVSRVERSLRAPPTRGKALGLLATLAHAGRLPAELSRWRRAAHRELRRRVLREKRDTIWRRVYAASPAAPASIWWCFLFAPLWVQALAAEGSAASDTGVLVLAGAAAGFVGFILALPIALGSVYERSRSLVLREADLPFRGTIGPVALGAALRLPLLGLIVALADLPRMAGSAGAALAGAVVALAATPWIARWARRCCGVPRGRGRSLLGALFWCTLCAVAPFTAAHVFRLAVVHLGWQAARHAVAAVCVGAALASFGGFITGIAQLSARFEAPMESDAPAPPCPWARRAAIAAAVLVVPAALAAFR